MRTAYSVETVRAAERALMARLPEGALMQRAAAGLAAACAGLLRRARGGVYGARVVLLVGPGDNGGDALYAGARLARRGAGVTAVPMDPGRMHPGGLAALRAAGGRLAGSVPRARTSYWTGSSASAGGADCARRPRPWWNGSRRGSPWSRWTCRAGWTRTPARWRVRP